MTKYTKDQERILNHRKGDLLVSASAGAGKTTVLLERIARIIVEKRVSIDEILLLTFTNAVAGEMRERLKEVLISKLLEVKSDVKEEEFLKEQIDNLHNGNIATLHAFAAKCLREHSSLLDISSGFEIIDEEISNNLLDESINDVFEQEYNENPTFLNTLSGFFGNDDEIKSGIKRIIQFANSLGDTQKWLDKTISSSYKKDYEKTELAKYFLEQYKEKGKDILDRINKLKLAGLHQNSAKVLGQIAELTEIIINAKTLAEVVAQKDVISQRLYVYYRGKVDSVESDEVLSIRNSFYTLKNSINSFYDDEQMRKDIVIAKTTVEDLALLVKKSIEVYQEKKGADQLDYNDLEHCMLSLIQIKEVQEELANTFKYVCVDEYQDINPLQDEIIAALSQKASLMMIGDLKQSIYQFRFAEPDIFLNKIREYKADKSNNKTYITLNENFRSHGEILTFVNQIFKNVMTEGFGGIDYKNEAQLIEGAQTREKEKSKSVVDIEFYYKANQDDKKEKQLLEDDKKEKEEYIKECGRSIARKIQDLVENEMIFADGKMRKVQYDDIFILFQDRVGDVQDILEEIKNNNIPIDDTGAKTKENNKALKKLINLLGLIDNTNQDILLVEMLLSYFGQFSLDEIVMIKNAYKKEKLFYRACQKYLKNKKDNIQKKLKEFYSKIESWHIQSYSQTVQELMLNIIADTNYRNYIVMSSLGGKRELMQINEFISDLEKREYNNSLFKFLEHFRAHDVKVQNMPLHSDNMVQTSTIHKSKGLEYPIVFLIDALKNKNFRSSNFTLDKDFGMAIKTYIEDEGIAEENLVYKLINSRRRYKESEEKMRLLYVGLTRAKNRLFISGVGFRNETGFNYEMKIDTPKGFANIFKKACQEDPALADFVKIYNIDKSAEIRKNEKTEQKGMVLNSKMPEIKKYLNYKYPHKEAINTKIKYTVTELNDLMYKKLPMLRGGKQAENSIDEDKTLEGSLYHKVLENIKYDVDKKQIADELDRMVELGILTSEEIEKINVEYIEKTISNRYVSKAAIYPHYNEINLRGIVSADEVFNKKIKDEIYIQGASDLVILGKEEGGKNLLIDFKYSDLDAEQIKKSYETQMHLYSKILEGALDIKFDIKMIYVIGQDIEIFYD